VTAGSSVQEALNRGEVILAIKRLRQATGLGLKGPKDYVDELRRRSGASTRG
jgi:ribosomal protein L7/L12